MESNYFLTQSCLFIEKVHIVLFSECSRNQTGNMFSAHGSKPLPANTLPHKPSLGFFIRVTLQVLLLLSSGVSGCFLGAQTQCHQTILRPLHLHLASLTRLTCSLCFGHWFLLFWLSYVRKYLNCLLNLNDRWASCPPASMRCHPTSIIKN